MKIYLSGAMRGVPNNNFQAFADAALKLRLEGHDVFNPAATNLHGMSVGQIFAYDLNWLCLEAEAVAVIPGWENSLGVAGEIATAKAIGIEVIYL